MVSMQTSTLNKGEENMKKLFEIPEVTVVTFVSEVIADENDTSRVPGNWED